MNEKKIMGMEADVKAETNLSLKKLRVLLLHEFRLDRKVTEIATSVCITMSQDTLASRDSFSTTFVQSIQE